MEHTAGVQKDKKYLKKVLTIYCRDDILTKLSLRVTRKQRTLKIEQQEEETRIKPLYSFE